MPLFSNRLQLNAGWRQKYEVENRGNTSGWQSNAQNTGIVINYLDSICLLAHMVVTTEKNTHYVIASKYVCVGPHKIQGISLFIP